MEQQPSNKALPYVLPGIGIACLATLVLLFAFPNHINVTLGIFICLLLILFIYNIAIVAGKNIERIDNKLSIRDVFFKKFLFNINEIRKIEIHTNFICRIYDIKIIKVVDSDGSHKFYVAKIKPEELERIVANIN
ncbi:MAG TPA: hypothetical protein VEB40_11990 [Flavipsychrobacter sp.]|nr:hypothetical protein [Flavipsychrobacter sp.]